MEQLPDSRHEEYLQWLVTKKGQRVPPTKTAMAEKLGVHIRTLRDWENKPEFIKEHAKRVDQVVGSPEKYQQIMERLFDTAMDPAHKQHAQALKTWLDERGYLKGQVRKPTDHGADTKALTDEVLEKLISAQANEIAAQRGLKLVKDSGA